MKLAKGTSKITAEQILYSDDDILVLNKAAGQLSQSDKSGEPAIVDLLQDFFLANTGKKLEFLAPVHRLDRNTTGLIVLAKNPSAAKHLSEALQKGEVKRTYLAMVKGDPGKKGTIDAPLLKEEDSNESRVHSGGKRAVTYYHRMEKFPAASLVSVELETGRSHQIRAHFAHIRCALLGDKKYAKKPWSEIFPRPALHAATLQFPHPGIGKVFNFTAPLPKDMAELKRRLIGS